MQVPTQVAARGPLVLSLSWHLPPRPLTLEAARPTVGPLSLFPPKSKLRLNEEETLRTERRVPEDDYPAPGVCSTPSKTKCILVARHSQLA